MVSERKLNLEFGSKQKEYLDYEEDRRMQDLSKMYNRAVYQATPVVGSSGRSRRIKTEQYEGERHGNGYQREPAGRLSTQQRQGNSGRHEVKDSLDNLNSESIRYPQKPNIS